MIWKMDHDRLLVRLAKQGMSREQIAGELSKALEPPVTAASVKSRLGDLRDRGVDVPFLPTGTRSTSHVYHRTPEQLRELSEIDRPLASPSSEAAPPILPKVNIDDALIARIVQKTAKAPLGFEAVCDLLGMAPAKTRDFITRAIERGYRINIDGDHVGVPPHASPVEEQTVAVEDAGKLQMFAAVGDIHFGSKHHMGPQFKDFCSLAYKRGVRQFLHVGDLLDGVYSHSMWEQSARGFEEQVAVAIKELPQWPDATWHFIQGNHDETLGEKSGLDVGRAIEQAFVAAGRTDLKYHGARGAYLRLKPPDERRGLLVELWHPRDKGNAYALTYHIQKKIEGYAPGTKPDVLLVGHCHTSVYVPVRGVHAISCGCFQGGQSSFGKSLAGSPSIGSWIVRYAMTPGGTVRRFSQEWISYQEVETIRDVGLG
jgi:predicted phosphodiesterase